MSLRSLAGFRGVDVFSLGVKNERADAGRDG